ncbi:conserved hypothetical protein [Aspergillus lentulus]|uniref:Uncharacterized protein n=1 Tax=Aspergillus lentulus TaxID=293939 RepID=A0AAN5YIR2_ASPLE|nr:conserved hypothetical protein [Aspergillus lentulus]KAF4157117.1 hypothetical protein CNMCM6069_005889 [Aspergillus lentulus]KAF4168190.1 hypothetical protein CNMCM6936_003298 [Aspergillus lentulus]KAF4202044.1 hypothetical protein CNMCM8927_000701 [Aspergillus lentulus]GFF38370.1 conserved hypothetical protein [Aspergillus lentulus]GFF83232.1 conserved hypothetical protein [Aspergillus lentulus]
MLLKLSAMSNDQSVKIVSANGVPVFTLRLAPGSGGSTSEETVARHPFQNTEDFTTMPWINPEPRICSEKIKYKRRISNISGCSYTGRLQCINRLSAANSTDREDLLQNALNYHSQSLQLFAPTLEDLIRSDCNAAFSLSLILILFSFAAPLLVVGDSGMDAIYELYQVCVFVKKMMNFSVGIYGTVKRGVLAPLVHIDDSVSELSGSPLTAIACLSDLNSRAYDRNPSHEFQMYQESIDRLVDPLGKLGDPGSHRLSGVFMWVFHVPDRFFQLVQKRDAFALIILAHFCVLLHDLRNHWWMSSWGYKVIVAIYRTLDADLRYSLSWPLLQIGYTGEI